MKLWARISAICAANAGNGARNRMGHFFAVLVVFRQMNEPMPPAMQKSGGRKKTDHRNRLPDKLGQNRNFTRKWTGRTVYDYIKIKSALEGS